MNAAGLTVVLLMLANTNHASDELVDIEFLEWLGQTAEVEELGMDINALLEEQEKQKEHEDIAEDAS